jgi:hypothetical protein
MRLDNEVELDYKDVLLKPKRSTLSSRRDVEMTGLKFITIWYLQTQ